MRVFRVSEFLGSAFVFSFLAILLAFLSEVLRVSHSYDVAHFLASMMLVASFTLLYQDRIFAVLNTFAAQAMLLSMAVAWQGYTRNHRICSSRRPWLLALKASSSPSPSTGW